MRANYETPSGKRVEFTPQMRRKEIETGIASRFGKITPDQARELRDALHVEFQESLPKYRAELATVCGQLRGGEFAWALLMEKSPTAFHRRLRTMRTLSLYIGIMAERAKALNTPRTAPATNPPKTNTPQNSQNPQNQ